MDPVFILILKQRLQAAVLKRNLANHFSNLFHPTTEATQKLLEEDKTKPERGQSEIREGGEVDAIEDQDEEPTLQTPAEPQEDSENTSPVEPSIEADAPPEMTFEEAQACRDETYIRFDGCEEVDDYTEGPARFVPGFDGVKDCAALLMTYELSQAIQNALLQQRFYAKEVRHAEEQIEKIEAFEQEIEDELWNHNARITCADTRSEVADPDQDAQIEGWKSAIRILERVRGNMRDKKEYLQSGLSWKAKTMRQAHNNVSAYLDEAFVQACLMDPAEPEDDEALEEFDLQEHYKEAAQEEAKLNSTESMDAPVPELDTTPVNVYRKDIEEPTEEELQKQRILETLWAAEDRVRQAEATFDNRDDQQAYEQQVAYKAELAGGPIAYATVEELDLHWVKRNHEITHELIEAEEAYSQAKAAAIEAHVQFQTDNQSSCCQEDFEATGYPMSQEIDVEAAAAWVTPGVDSWLEDVPEEACSDCQSSVDVDEWDFQEVDLSDSLSCVDYAIHRKRIDRWQLDCQAVKESLS